jgi:hypothetical protein
MKKALLALILGTLSLGLTAQKRTIDVDRFDALSFGLAGEMYVRQGNSRKVEIECSDSDLEKIRITSTSGHLKIVPENNSSSGWNAFKDVKVWITVPELDNVTVSGSGQLIGENTFKGNTMDLTISGSGSLKMDVDAKKAGMRLSGSGRFEVSGNAEEADMVISGSGKINAEDLEVDRCEITISGSGQCYITARKEINATISGSGDVYYNGNPQVNTTVAGSGKVRKK